MDPVLTADPVRSNAAGGTAGAAEQLALFVGKLREISDAYMTLSPAGRGLVGALLRLATFALRLMVFMVASPALGPLSRRRSSRSCPNGPG